MWLSSGERKESFNSRNKEGTRSQSDDLFASLYICLHLHVVLGLQGLPASAGLSNVQVPGLHPQSF